MEWAQTMFDPHDIQIIDVPNRSTSIKESYARYKKEDKTGRDTLSLYLSTDASGLLRGRFHERCSFKFGLNGDWFVFIVSEGTDVKLSMNTSGRVTISADVYARKVLTHVGEEFRHCKLFMADHGDHVYFYGSGREVVD